MIINATDLGTLVISQPSSELPPIRISLNVAVGGSLPAGGTVNQILRKSSSAPYDVEWSNDQDAQWGQVTGTITAQGDLMALLAAKQSVSGMSNYLTLSQALAGYYPLNNPAGYVTASAIDDFLTTTEASAIYQTQANMVSYITDADAAIKLEPYCYPRYSNPSGFISAIDAANTFYPLHTNPANYATQSWVTGQSYLTASALTGYATQSWVGSQGYITSASLPDLSGYAALSGATFSGTVYAPTIRNLLNTDLVIDSYNDDAAGTHFLHKFTPFDGKFVLAPNGGGLTFPDGTTQVTAAVSFNPVGYATESFVTSQGYITSASLPDLTGYATESFVTSQGYIGFDSYKRITFANGTNPDPVGLAGRFWYQSEKLRFSSTTTQINTIASEGWVTSQGYLTNANLSGYAQLSGATFTGKVNCTVVAGAAGLNMGIGGIETASTTAGDIWVSAGSSYLNYRDSGGSWRYCLANNLPNAIDLSTATNPALRITQRGTANALVVEDSTSPDSTAFVIDQFGKVGIGTAPDATAAIKIDGNGMSFNGLIVKPTSVANPLVTSGNMSHGEYLKELLITINGVNYAIPLRVV